jgi:hypothetical protein
MKNKVNVVIVKFPPAIGKPEMMGGIRSKEEVVNWAEKNGYATVYFFQSRQRVYADKLTKDVATLAKQVQTKSNHLVQIAEV